MESKKEKRPERGKILTAYILFMMIANIVYFYLAISGELMELPWNIEMPSSMSYLYIFLTSFGIIFLSAIWRMRKWGVYGIIALMIIEIIYSHFVSTASYSIIGLILTPLIFVLVIWKPFKRML